MKKILIILFLFCTVTLAWSGNAVLSLKWDAPVTNDNAKQTCLTDLAGFNIYISHDDGVTWNLLQKLLLKDSNCKDLGVVSNTSCGNYPTCSYSVTEPEGVYKFKVTAYDNAEKPNESKDSNVVAKTFKDTQKPAGCLNLR